MNNKLISIIIPVYNVEKYLKETLDSVKAQTYTYWECIIVDDGSKDYSKKIALEYCKKDKRFRYYFQSNAGPSAARNFGLAQSKGEYIQFLDADDVILSERLELLLRKYISTKGNVILYSNMLLGDSKNIYKTSLPNRPANIGKDISFNDMYRRFALDFLFIPSCLLLSKRVTSNVKWNEKLNYSEDWDYYLSILKNNYVFRCLPEPLAIYRNRQNSLSKNKLKEFEAKYKILRQWVNKSNLLFFSRRCALLYKNSIILYLLKKSNMIVKPQFDLKKTTLQIRFFILLIYSYTFFYLLQEILRFLFKKVKL